MAVPAHAVAVLEQEARALLTRLAQVRAFALTMPTTPAAAARRDAQHAIDEYLVAGRRELRELVHGYLRWLKGPARERSTAEQAQRQFTLLRLRFNKVLTQFDLFADVLTQRGEHGTGARLAGLDALAADALDLGERYFEAPPVLCYLDRGHGAAIRRARTRLPGGGENPVAIVRVPRERMVGSGIAASLLHEVGHQAAALLGLVDSLRGALRARQQADPDRAEVWGLWERWISEIVSDFWALGHLGVGATMGLISVVSLPRAFVFRVQLDDPHPFPWIRARLSCALGDALFPHPQWGRLARLWHGFYPTAGLDERRKRLVADLEASLPDFAELLTSHRPKSLRGRSLAEVLPVRDRQPAALAALHRRWAGRPEILREARPSLVFAVLGQAKADGRLSPEAEADVIGRALDYWAVRGAIGAPRSLPPAKAA